MTLKVGFCPTSFFFGSCVFLSLAGKTEFMEKRREKRAKRVTTQTREGRTHKRARNVFIQSDKAGVGSPQMVGFGETRADDESFGEERRRERHADVTESRPEETRDSFPESPFALGRPDRGSEDARHRSRDVYNHTERDKDRD